MSTLTYNGISIDLLRTREVAYEPVRDGDGTYLYTAVRIAITGVINPKATGYALSGGVIGTPDNAKPTDSTRAIRHALLQERGPLVYDVGDATTPMIVSPEPGFVVDCNNGPIPGPMTLTRLDGGKTFHVSYSITTWMKECPGTEPGSESDALLSNRYGQGHQIDEHHFTTIVTTGQAMFRTDVLEDVGDLADTYRDVLIPPVPKGFQRMGIHIAATPSRNALTYQVVDREMFFDLGNTGPDGSKSGITKVDASFEVTSMGEGQAPISPQTMQRVSVQVWGDKTSKNWSLIKFALSVVETKLPLGDPNKGLLRQASVMSSMTSPHVAVSYAMQINQAANGVMPGLNDLELRDDSNFADQGGLNPPFPGRKGTAGTYTNLALAEAWTSACSAEAVPEVEGDDDEVGTGADAVSGRTGPIVTATTTADLPEIGTAWSYDQTQYAYTDYRIDVLYHTKTYVMQVPSTGPASPQSSGSSGSPGSGSMNGGGPPMGSVPGDPGYVGGGPGGGAQAIDAPGAGGDGPGGDSPPECEFLTLARGTTRVVYEWTCERIGSMPKIPDPTPSDPNRVLIDAGDITFTDPALTVDGDTFTYRVHGRYVYGLRRKLKGTDLISLPMSPWQSLPYGSAVANLGDMLSSGIIDGPQSAGSAGAALGPDN